MRHLRRLAAAAAAATMLCATAAVAQEEVSTTFVDGSGNEVGTATLTQTPNGVLLALSLTGLPEGEHGFHIHEKGACDPAQKFETAGGHLAGGKEHGFKTEGGPHAGDMPNVFVGADGVLRVHVVNDRVALTDGNVPLFDADGSSLMIHGMADDYASQPSGHAGERLACAPLMR